MAIRHGLFMGPHSTGVRRAHFRYGIRNAFNALRAGPFLASAEQRQRAAVLEYHFSDVCQRLVFSLQRLDSLMQELTSMYVPGQASGFEVMRVHFEADTVADHLMSYLNMMVDDVAIMTTQATGYIPSSPKWAVDSFGKLRRDELRAEAAFQPIKALLDATDASGSWWDLGFATRTGARQLVIHNQHLVDFQLSSAPGGTVEARAVIRSPYADNPFPCRDFFALLRSLFDNLFVWLDELEAVLIDHLKAQAPTWQPQATCPGLLLPVGYPIGETIYSREYFPISPCDDSEDLPWTIEVRGPDA
jgi:hypothetical protein